MAFNITGFSEGEVAVPSMSPDTQMSMLMWPTALWAWVNILLQNNSFFGGKVQQNKQIMGSITLKQCNFSVFLGQN